MNKNKAYLVFLYQNIIRFTPDFLFISKYIIKRRYQKKMLKELDWNNIKTLNETLQYIKVFDRNELYTLVADKLRVKGYLNEKINEKYIIETYDHGDSYKNFDLKNIKKFPCIIKVNHDCSGGLIIRNPNKELINVKGISKLQKNISEFSSVFDYNNAYIRHFLKVRLNYNHYYSSREWQYKNIKPCFLIEELLEDNNGQIPNDYKFHCFNGRVEFIYVSIDREGKDYRKIYDRNWNALPFTWCKIGSEHVFDGDDIDPPQNFNEMLNIAEKISKDFRYIRVDLYSDGVFTKCGELTLQHGSGFEPILPECYDLKFGKLAGLL
ncbi:ATP-grasp fold amidoligase family protein [Photobacterium phosphoreum]|uniref:ATP-grasp fold amidoligase family protein n=1 Tax=Photobacterium phosphoreum TaxID=659 RepID=UPI0011B2486F|nr:ATP-grasp fold amidoligase family protein [Photobacterium phosphoreum]